jgi:hypothetical protein
MQSDQRNIMQPDHNLTTKIETCDNRFEVICRWGEPIDMDWTRSQLEAWLQRRMDAQTASVYDADILLRGNHD